MSLTVGIDLGTTNSCIAFHDGSAPFVIETPEGLKTLPSVVAITERGDILVGRPALNQSKSNPQHSFLLIKRMMGVKWNDGEEHGAQTVRGPDGLVWLKGPDRDYSPAELSSRLISAMLDAAEAKLEERPDGAVITVPAHFGEAACQATREAAERAGLKRIRLLTEPVAAAVAYGIERKKYTRLAIYDLGGGTFDIALMDVTKERQVEVGKSGDRNLGGTDFDSRIVSHVTANWHGKNGEDIGLSDDAVARVRDASETAKITLSRLDDTTVDVKWVSTSPGGALHMREPLSKAVFETLTGDLIQKTLDICGRTMAAAGRTKEDVDEVILVGGMTRMPKVKQAVEAFFGRKPQHKIDVETVVAIGAATAAAADDNLLKFKLDKKTALSFGVRAQGRKFYRVIPRGMAYPVKASVLITTSEDGQDTCTIHVLEGEDHRADQNAKLSHMHVPVSKGPKGEVSLEVEFTLDENALLRVEGVQDGERFPIYEGGSSQ